MSALPDLRGKRIAITGANTGIGRATALALGGAGAELLLLGRSRERTESTLAALGPSARFVAVDLADLPSVRVAVSEVLSLVDRLDVLVNNAGLAGTRGVTKQGFEIAFGTNHLGPFALTQGLWPLLERAPEPRVVNVASRAHLRPRALDLDAVRRSTASTTGLDEYGVSKLCNVLHARALARLHPRVFSTSLHPGVIASDVWREVPWPARAVMKWFMKTNEEGAQTSIMLATRPLGELENGGYYAETKKARVNRLAEDRGLEEELWRRSEAWVQEFGG